MSEYKHLIDECISLLSERKFDLGIRDLEWRHELGQLIEASDIYQKSEEKTKFIENLGKDIGISAPLVYQCLEFYRKFPDFDGFISSFKPEKKSLRWSDVRMLLVENPTECSHTETYIERLVINRVKCKKCNKTIKEEKSKYEE